MEKITAKKMERRARGKVTARRRINSLMGIS
jgi:hypothetical protein